MILKVTRAATGSALTGVVAVIMVTFFAIALLYVQFGKWLVDRTGDPTALREGGRFITRIPVPWGWFSRWRARRSERDEDEDDPFRVHEETST